jgi:hypothetical protein
MPKSPAGITSSVKADGKMYILQTEFFPISGINPAASGPNSSAAESPAGGKIITSVAVNGQVVHKVEKFYDNSWDSEEDFALAEKAIKHQHLSIARVVAARSREFLKAASRIDITPEDRLRVIPGVCDVLKLNLGEEGEEPAVDDSPSQLQRNFKQLRNLIMMISKNTRLGKLRRAAGLFDQERFMLTGLGGNVYYLTLKGDADASVIFEELDKIKSA